MAWGQGKSAVFSVCVWTNTDYNRHTGSVSTPRILATHRTHRPILGCSLQYCTRLRAAHQAHWNVTPPGKEAVNTVVYWTAVLQKKFQDKL